VKRPRFLDEKPKYIIYFVTIELVIAFLGILLATITLLIEPSSELQGITPPMNVVLTFLDLFGGISLGTILGLIQSLLIQKPILFFLSSSVVALLFSGLNLISLVLVESESTDVSFGSYLSNFQHKYRAPRNA